MRKFKGFKNNFIKLSSFQILVRFRRGLFYSFLSIYLRFYLNLSVTETTLFATFPMIINILFQNFIWGALSDKLQKRRTFIILGEILAAVGTILTWYFHTLQPDKHLAGYVIIIGLTIIEIFWSMSNLGWTAILSDLYKPTKLAEIRGKLASMGGVGRIIGVLIGGIAYDGLGNYYRGWGFSEGVLFFIAAGMMLLSCIPIIFLPEGGITEDDKKSWNKQKNRSRERSISRLFWLFIISMVFINFGRNSIATIKSQFFSLEDGLNLNPQMLSYIVNMRSVAMILFGAITGLLLKKLKEEWLLFVSSVVGAIHLLIFILANSVPIAFFANFIGGGAQVLIFASSYSVVNYMIPPRKRGRKFAIYNATLFLSWGVAGTLIAGPVADYLLSEGFAPLTAYRGSFWTGVCLSTIGLALLLIFISQFTKFHRFDDKNFRI